MYSNMCSYFNLVFVSVEFVCILTARYTWLFLFDDKQKEMEDGKEKKCKKNEQSNWRKERNAFSADKSAFAF